MKNWYATVIFTRLVRFDYKEFVPPGPFTVSLFQKNVNVVSEIENARLKQSYIYIQKEIVHFIEDFILKLIPKNEVHQWQII